MSPPPAKPTLYRSSLPDVSIPTKNAAQYVLDSSEAILGSRTSTKPAFIDARTKTSFTFAQLRAHSEALAHAFVHSLSINKSDVIALFAANHIMYPVVVYATLLAGATITTVNATYTVDELVFQLKDSNTQTIITDKDSLPRALQAVEAINLPRTRIFVVDDAAIDDIPSITSIYSPTDSAAFGFQVPLNEKEIMDMPAFLTYSSGTTGISKGVMITHYNMVANVCQLTMMMKPFSRESDSWISFLPFFHIYGLNTGAFLAPSMGVTFITMHKFDLIFYLKTVQALKPTVSLIVPPVALLLARHPLTKRFNLSSLEFFISGAAALSADLSQELSNVLNVTVLQGYGLTETSPIVAFCPSWDPVHGSIGVLVPNIDVRLVDPDTGLDVAENQPGEMWIRGPNIMKGYHNNPDATTACIDSDGYFHTGDMVTIDTTTNHMRVVDRIKELIKYNGLQVAPAELESVILSHPAVQDCVVIGTPDEACGEIPTMYVSLKPGQVAYPAHNYTVRMEDVQMHVMKRVAPHKQVRGGVVFVDAIPMTVSGKVLRRVVRQWDAERIRKMEEDEKEDEERANEVAEMMAKVKVSEVEKDDVKSE